MQDLATALFLVGIALSIFLGTPWIGIALMVGGLLISLSLLFLQWRRQER